MTRPPTAVLVLLSCVIPMSPWPRAVVKGSLVGHPESPFADRMALFQHVLINDAGWSPVLNQRVKLSALSLPRYRKMQSNEEFLDRMQLVNEDEDPPVMKVLQKLMEKTPWSGTNVNYTAYALSTAVTCFTYNNVSFVLSLVVNRIGVLARKVKKSVENNYDNQDKKEDNENNDGNNNGQSADNPEDNIDVALDDVRMTLVLMADKLAAVEGELAFFASGLYDYDGAEKTDDDLILLRVLEMIKDEVDVKLERHCHPTPHTEIYRYLRKHGRLNDPPPLPDELAPDDETLKHELVEFNKIIDCMIQVYDELDVNTMPMETWLQILDYRLPISMETKFYIDGVLKDLNKFEESWSNRLRGASIIENKKKKKKANKKLKKKSKTKNKN